jgi:hypothetical protein
MVGAGIISAIADKSLSCPAHRRRQAYARYLAEAESGTLGRNNVVYMSGTFGWLIGKYKVYAFDFLKNAESPNGTTGSFAISFNKRSDRFSLST